MSPSTRLAVENKKESSCQKQQLSELHFVAGIYLTKQTRPFEWKPGVVNINFVGMQLAKREKLRVPFDGVTGN
eukprot:2040337-Amphidinium_carterae.1